MFVDIEPDTANIDPNLIEDTIISRCVIRVGVDEPTPERQSAVRDHVMRCFQEAREAGALAFPRQCGAMGRGDGR